MNRLSITSAPLPAFEGADYYDLDATLRVMEKLWNKAAVDTFEFQWLAEWDETRPPRAEHTSGSRRQPWQESYGYEVDSLAETLLDSGVPIRSVHANRDVGIYLCGDAGEIEHGRQMIRDTLELAKRVGASVTVFHAWNTYSEAFNPAKIESILAEESARFSGILASVENVPTHLGSCTPASLVENFDWITLDTRWAAMYDELSSFERLKEKIVNIHIRGHLSGTQWTLPDAPYSFEEVIQLVLQRWKYTEPLTLEPEGGVHEESWLDFLQALDWLKRVIESHSR